MDEKPKVRLKKCCVCENTNQNSNASFHRFLKPGKTNIKRARLLAEWAFPGGDFSSEESLTKLYTSNKWFCSAHFSQDAFVELEPRRIHRYSLPVGVLPHHELQTSIPVHTDTCLRHTSIHTSVQEVGLPNNNGQIEDAEINETVTTNETNTPPRTIKPSTSTPHSRNFKKCDNHSNSEVKSNEFDVSVIVPTTPKRLKRKGTEVMDQPSAKRAKRFLLKDIDCTRIRYLTPRKKKLVFRCRRLDRNLAKSKAKCVALKRRLRAEKLTKEESFKVFTRQLTPSAALFLRAQIRCGKRKPKGRRWTQEDKILSLSIYKKSPSCYRLLRKMFILPSESSLKLLLSNIHLSPGICDNLLKSLEKCVKKMKKGNNTCLLLFDEMSIRKHLAYNRKKDEIHGFQDHGLHGRTRNVANSSLVFMVVGLKKKWKQPIAFYLSGNNGVSSIRLQAILKDVLDACFSIGLDVVGTVCDMGTNNTSALNQLKGEEYDAFFTYKERKICTIFDAPHLLKSLRNMFMKYNIEFDVDSNIIGMHRKGIAKWKHIKQLYDYDRQTIFKMAPKLTEQHVNPNNKQKMKVKLATQAISHTVSAGLHVLNKSGGVYSGADQTAHFVKNFDTLFDSLNGTFGKKVPFKECQGAVTKKSKHLTLWHEEKKTIKNMRFLTPSSKQPPSKEGWLVTISAAEHIWKLVQAKGFKYLETRRLNQDPLENLFGDFRRYSGCNSNPNQDQFEGAFKTSLLAGLTLNNLPRGNCENDDLFFLDNIQTLLEPPQGGEEDWEEQEKLYAAQESDFKEYCKETLGKEELKKSIYSVAYVSGFVVHQLYSICKKILGCETCSEELTSSEMDPANIFIFLKEFTSDKERLRYPSSKLGVTVALCTNAIQDFLDRSGHKRKLRKTVIGTLQKEEVLFTWLTCIEHKMDCVQIIVSTVFFVVIKFWCKKFNQRLRKQEAEKALRRRISIIKGC